MKFKGRIAVMPCTGTGRVLGTIARQAGYRVCDEERPEQTVLLCLPGLVKGIREDTEMMEQCPVVVIDGCRDRCGAYALSLKGGKLAAIVYVPDVWKGARCQGRGLKVKQEARRQLTENELAVVELVTLAVVAEVDRLLKEAPG